MTRAPRSSKRGPQFGGLRGRARDDDGLTGQRHIGRFRQEFLRLPWRAAFDRVRIPISTDCSPVRHQFVSDDASAVETCDQAFNRESPCCECRPVRQPEPGSFRPALEAVRVRQLPPSGRPVIQSFENAGASHCRRSGRRYPARPGQQRKP